MRNMSKFNCKLLSLSSPSCQSVALSLKAALKNEVGSEFDSCVYISLLQFGHMRSSLQTAGAVFRAPSSAPTDADSGNLSDFAQPP